MGRGGVPIAPQEHTPSEQASAPEPGGRSRSTRQQLTFWWLESPKSVALAPGKCALS